MDKKTKKLLLLTGVLFLLLLLLSGVKYLNQKKEKKQEEENEAAKIYVTDLSDVSEISYNMGDGEYTFVKRDDTWVYTEDEAFPIQKI